MAFRIKDGFTVGTTDIVNSSAQLLVYQKDTTTIGQNLSKIPDVTQISFIRINANETVDALSAADFRTAIDAVGSSSTNFLSSATNSTQDGYFGNIALRDDTNPSHYLILTNASDLSANRTLSINPNDADRTISLSGNLTLANSFTTSGNNALTLTTTAATNVTLPTSGTLATTGQSFFFGTTSIAINRASAALSIAGINTITGEADVAASLTIQASNGSGSNVGNNLLLRGGGGGGSANGGTIEVRGGSSPGGVGGSATVTGGDSAGVSGGSVEVRGGLSTIVASGGGGSVTVRGGDSNSTSTSATGGNVVIRGGVANSTDAITKTGGSVYIDGGQPNTGGTITTGAVFIGNQSNSHPTGTAHVTIGKSGTEVRLPGVGTSGLVRLGANGALSAETATYLATTGGTLSGNLTVGGDLVVNGTLTSVNSNTLTVNDKNLELASVDAVTGLEATLVGSTNSVTLTAGTTNTLVAGQRLTKTGQTGVFGGTGTGLTLNTTTTAGAVTSATINSGGSNYSVGDLINISGGGGTAGGLVTSTNGPAGAVTGFLLTAGGSGYSSGTGVATTVALAAGPYILSITNSTTFTVNVNHSTAGWIQFSSGAPTNLTADGGGITLKGSTDKTIIWDNANTNWTSSEHWNIATGKTFKINNTTVLSSTQVLGRTLGGTTAGDIVTIEGTQTLTNKTFTDSTTTFQDDADNTKKLQFQLSGIATGTTRTLTVPNATDTIAVIGTAQTFTAAQTFRATNSIRAEAASAQDAVVLAGRAGGTGSFAVTLTPTTLSANRTLTFSDVTGTVHSSGARVIRLGGDTSTSDIVSSRGIESLYNGQSATARRLVGAGTTTAVLTMSLFISDWGIGDLITVSGATSAEGAKTNGSWRVTSVVGETLTVSYATNGANPSIITGTITGSDPNHQTGDQITISGANPSSLNGTWTITRTGTTTFTFTATTQIATITTSGTTRVPTVRFVVGSTINSGSYIAATDLGSVNISKVSAISTDQSGNVTFIRHSTINTNGVLSPDGGRTTNLSNVTGNLGIFTQVTQTPLSGSGGTYNTTISTIVRGGAATDSNTEAVGGDVLISGGTATLLGGTSTSATGGSVNITGGQATGGTQNIPGSVNIGLTNTNFIQIGNSTNAIYLDGVISSGLKVSVSGSTEALKMQAVGGASPITTTNVTVMDSWSANTYRSATYIVQVTQSPGSSPEWYSSKIGILHNGTVTTMTEYEVLETGSIPIEFTSAINGTNVELRAQVSDGNTRNATVKMFRTLIAV